ncbi:MAG: (Fe-S)-binding protein [Elusimicrobia bacterium]|nr:(Fe-S)-binding protein [Elusimicrobiota bacterium]
MGSVLGRLVTDLGERSTYDAASQCSRCGYCEQACPTYVATGRESRSGRGRNQLVRRVLEGGPSGSPELREALSTCLLCGACTSACYARVPTADIVLEGRRMLGAAPRWVERLLSFVILRPGLLDRALKLAFLFKKAGLSRLASKTGFLSLLGLEWLAVADVHVDEAPSEFLVDKLRTMPSSERPAWFYLASCGPNYLFPRVGLATFKALSSLRGPGRLVASPCCGLVCYNYGDVGAARELSRRVIERWEAEAARVEGGGELPVVVDCSSCAAHMKSYPQLNLDDAGWRRRAELFAGRVRDVVEVYAECPLPPAGLPGTVTYHESCRCRHGQGIVDAPRSVLRAVAAERFVEMPDSDACCGGAGAFAFSHQELSDALLRRKVGNIASVQARWVAASATSCLIQLARGLKNYYPDAKVLHLSEIVAAAVSEREEEKGNTS